MWTRHQLTGPKFFFHSTPDGGFSANDAAAQNAVLRACGKAPREIVVLAGGAVNLQKTAENLVCVRVRGTASGELRAELESKHRELCADQATCPVTSALEAWLTAPLPVELGAPAPTASAN